MEWVTLLGASGRTGRAVLDAALRRGLRVRGLFRPGSEPNPVPAGLAIVVGQLSSAEDVGRSLAGSGAVCCVYGPRSVDAAPFCAEATAHVVHEMRSLRMRRLVVQTGAMVGGDAGNLGWLYRGMARGYRRKYLTLAADGDSQERYVRESGLDWTLVKPPRLKDGPARRRVRASPTLRIGAFAVIPRADLAEFLCDELTRGRFHRQAVYVSG
ncbi:MAG TPA: NAD(P)H-binding protein [Thermoplasmata archaeon]|nr:NAD(P)H-binding protein [Thermoplasmata archaeon]